MVVSSAARFSLAEKKTELRKRAREKDEKRKKCLLVFISSILIFILIFSSALLKCVILLMDKIHTWCKENVHWVIARRRRRKEGSKRIASTSMQNVCVFAQLIWERAIKSLKLAENIKNSNTLHIRQITFWKELKVCKCRNAQSNLCSIKIYGFVETLMEEWVNP